MNVASTEGPIPPVPPEPFALIAGPASPCAGPEALERAMRRMGLRPERLWEGGDDPLPGARCFRLSFGGLSVLAGPAGDNALGAADPAHPSTSLLAASLPRDWRTPGQCWMFVPQDGGGQEGGEDRPARMREFFNTMVLAIDLFDASHIFWSPASLWSDARQFRASVSEMLVSGMPPVLHLVAFRRHESGQGDIVSTRGLALFAGQELEGRLPGGWTVAEMVKRLARLALDIMLNGPIGQPERVRGLDPGEWVTLSPRAASGGARSLVLVEFGGGH